VIVFKAGLVLGIACAAMMMLRRRSAAWRHAALALGFGIVGVLPILELAAPGWGATVAPSLAGLSAAASADVKIVRTLWYSGALIGVSGIVIGLMRIAWIRASARIVDARRHAIADDAAVECGLRRGVVVLETDRPVMPVTWGLFRPKILLPDAAREWTDECLRAVFRHELAHVQRGDWVVQLLATLITRVFWFNPVVWLASRQLRIESERACDDAVLNLGVEATDYAAQLIRVARATAGRQARIGLAPAASQARGLERRIAATLDAHIDRTPLSGFSCAIAAALFVGAALPIAGFGKPPASASPALLGVQREVLRRFGGEERKFSIVAGDVSFWKNKLEGRVELQARLNVDGSVSGLRVVEPVHPDLATAAEVIVRNWRREPARVRGVPVEVPIRMTVDFRK
jgi:TonB family protein